MSGVLHDPKNHPPHHFGVGSRAGDERYLIAALGTLVAFMAGEVVVAFSAHSLVLLSDAGHMLSDVVALAAALWAMRLARRPARGAWTFGWTRAEILSAAGNGIMLLVVGGLITFEAIDRLIAPPRVAGLPVLITALVGIVVNLAVGWVLSRAGRASLNVEGAFQHIMTDLYGFIGAAIAAIVVLTTGFRRADAIASLVVVLLMFKAAWGLLRESGRVLLEAAPESIALDVVRNHLLQTPHVRDVHDLHIWMLTSSLPTLSAHVVVDDECFTDNHAPRLLDELQACLTGHFDVEHSTFQFEPASHAGHEGGAHA
ncbi:MAG: cation diffusion facilitator family transporter [Acidothermaceae bacterium]